MAQSQGYIPLAACILFGSVDALGIFIGLLRPVQLDALSLDVSQRQNHISLIERVTSLAVELHGALVANDGLLECPLLSLYIREHGATIRCPFVVAEQAKM